MLLITEFCSSTFECNYCKAWDTTQYRLYKVLSESNLIQAWYLTYHSFNVDVAYRFRVVVAVVIDLVFVVDRMALRICLCSGMFKCLCTWVLPGHLCSIYTDITKPVAVFSSSQVLPAQEHCIPYAIEMCQ